MSAIPFSMDGYRTNMVKDLDGLRSAIEDALDDLDDYKKDELIKKFNIVARSTNALNCVWLDGSDSFNDMSESPCVDLFEEDDN
ncbi:hypothetical protein [Photobacterium damselae]|uniref:hypothetical protein n=1 Tax=Photobacterium damselae TaxID=38293 RepID=UPI001F164071|nr:hypothetical protein [Photobacterium damselae]UKA04804.1 hypothetical protein IHC89_21415 [Photobacterium damselae subsp. damselae]